MALDSGGELEVDVLVVGGGIQGVYVAAALSQRYSVCLVEDPNLPPETLDSAGLISAGYDGNDPNRIQPARRAAGYWRMWSEMNGVPCAPEPTVYLVPEHEGLSRPRMWDDAMLTYRTAEDLPAVFEGGSLAGGSAYLLDDDVVFDPAVLLAAMRADLSGRCISGRVERCELIADEYIDHVEVAVGDETLSIVARSIVFAAGVGNADLLGMVAKRFGEVTRRREAQEAARTSQAVQLVAVVCARGEGLPEVSGWFGDLSIVSHTAGDSDETVWLVSLPSDDRLTTVGPQDLRFDPPSELEGVEAVLDRLMAVAPGLVELRSSLEWGTYTARRTQHPSLAVPDSSSVARPVPAKIETLGLDALVALWPSQLGYSMVLGDVVVERIEKALGDPGDFDEDLDLTEAFVSAESLVTRWERPDFVWSDWNAFSNLT